MITIRRAKLKDVPLLVGLWKEFMKGHDEIVMKENPKPRPYIAKGDGAADCFRKFIKKNIRSRNAVIHIAEEDGKVAGYSFIYVKNNHPPVFKLKKIGYISDLFVRDGFRGRGLSSRFKDEAVKWFRKKGVKHMSLMVYNDNKHAHSIYKKWGFFDYHVEMRRTL